MVESSKITLRKNEKNKNKNKNFSKQNAQRFPDWLFVTILTQ
jgi:hypothetical protein